MVAPLLSERAYHQLFEVRHLLEIHALTTSDLEAVDVEQLSNLVKAMSAQSHGPRYWDFKAFNRLDRAFHRTLVGHSGNSFLIVAWEELHFHLHVGRLYTDQGVIDFSTALREHAGIVEAIQAQDRPLLLDRASQHITHAEQRLKPLLDNTQRSE